MSTHNPTRAIDLMSGPDVLAKVVWAWGECTIITPVESCREPRLDCDNDLAVRVMIHDIRHGDPSGHLTFLWDDLLESHEAS